MCVRALVYLALLSHFLPFKIHPTNILPILIEMVYFKNLACATSFATQASRKFIYLPYRASGEKKLLSYPERYICISQIAVGEKPELSILHNPNTKASKEHIMRASAPSAIFLGNPAPNYIHASSLTVQLVNQEQEQTLLFWSTASSATSHRFHTFDQRQLVNARFETISSLYILTARL